MPARVFPTINAEPFAVFAKVIVIRHSALIAALRAIVGNLDSFGVIAPAITTIKIVSVKYSCDHCFISFILLPEFNRFRRAFEMIY
jgi:hypothetical protein